MGPKHKGFPRTQSIHFDQGKKKCFSLLLGLTPVRGPKGFEIVYKQVFE